MSLKEGKKISLNSVTHSVRASQAILQYGVGAMVDFPDQTLMTAAPEYWESQVQQIHDERLERVLGVEYFGMPGNQGSNHSEGISYVRFPEWYFCPQCRKFQPISSWLREYRQSCSQRQFESDPYMVKHPRCPTCRKNLVVTRIITVCEHGHIDDFPWVEWVHCRNFGGRKSICSHPSLTFKTGASSAEGLEGLIITCETCKAKTTLQGAFTKGMLADLDKKTGGQYDFTCKGRHPWKNTREACDLNPQVHQRGSSSVYFPVTASSLVIPPYSSLVTKNIENSNGFAQCKTSIYDIVKRTEIPRELKTTISASLISEYSGKIALETGIPASQVKAVLDRKWLSEDSDECSTYSVKYRAEEYAALSGEAVGTDNSGDFVREETEIGKYAIPFVKRISLINKIREVRALTGFTRVSPADKADTGNRSGDIVPIKEKSTVWYPAYEVRGEGIFIEFDEAAVARWQSNNRYSDRRVEILNENYQKSFIGSNHPRTITPKFLLLHTLSHLLIKQLSFECGYSIASLRERIYSSEAHEGKEMAGILIYTASGDSEGTMGGLVRQGYPDIFPALFKKAIESAVACSNDPVCSLSFGQGRDSLNLSACYSCALIPETSCEEYNEFLDRGVVVGTFGKNKFGFYSEQLFGNDGWTANDDSVAKSPEKPPLPLTVKVMFEDGIDMSDTKYSDIWRGLKQWSDNENEIAFLSALEKMSDQFGNKEKPLQDCTIVFAGNGERYKADLLWRKSKVLYFSSDNEDCFDIAKDSDWTCFCGCSADIDARSLISALRGV